MDALSPEMMSPPVRDARVSMVIQPVEEPEPEPVAEVEPESKPATRSRPQRNRKKIDYSEDTAVITGAAVAAGGGKRLTKKEKKAKEAAAKELQDATARAAALRGVGRHAGTAGETSAANSALNVSSASASSSSSATPRLLEGCTVRKDFKFRGIVTGVVTSYNREQEVYTIDYDDGQCEHLKRSDVELLLAERSILADDSDLSCASFSSVTSSSSTGGCYQQSAAMWGSRSRARST